MRPEGWGPVALCVGCTSFFSPCSPQQSFEFSFQSVSGVLIKRRTRITDCPTFSPQAELRSRVVTSFAYAGHCVPLAAATMASFSADSSAYNAAACASVRGQHWSQIAHPCQRRCFRPLFRHPVRGHGVHGVDLQKYSNSGCISASPFPAWSRYRTRLRVPISGGDVEWSPGPQVAGVGSRWTGGWCGVP